MKKIYTINMVEGPVFRKILVFSLPLAATGILQLLFNASDMIVVGKFAGGNSLAAVGATTSLIGLLTGTFLGVSIGVNIVVARYLGCQDEESVNTAIHTAIALSILLGIGLLILGLFLSVPLLRLMGAPEEIMSLSSLYLRIYFLGVPANITYNFGAAILRAFGDTQKPLLFLVFSGIINISLNLLLVVGFGLDVAGVAIATVAAQYISLILVLYCLAHTEGSGHLDLKKLKMDWREAKNMLSVGLPAGLQTAFFNVSNVIVQSTVNSFGANVIAAASAAGNLETFTSLAMDAVFQAAVTFTSQNMGAGKLKRIPVIFRDALLIVLILGISVGGLTCLFGRQLLSIYISSGDPSYDAVIQYGMLRLIYVCGFQFLCGMMNVVCGMVRGFGYAWLPMVIAIVGICGLRILWILTVFPMNRTLDTLYLAFPVSWVVTGAAQFVCYLVIWKKIKNF
ncbi:MATE family efflux transporter [Luxibacter massiliensis]|uniref:MATE family efflux transporter n=1 Tax=Luxibacter massiliensis TaxID=2219695 RepID=UPI000F04DC17|nr:MATE family efflux transporter [Luxibacter massiliensis]